MKDQSSKKKGEIGKRGERRAERVEIKTRESLQF